MCIALHALLKFDLYFILFSDFISKILWAQEETPI